MQAFYNGGQGSRTLEADDAAGMNFRYPARSEDQYLVGDWNGDGKVNIAVRRGNCVLMDTNFDGAHDMEQHYGHGNGEDQYLVGDWDGDGQANLAVRRGNCVLMDTNFDGTHDKEQCYGLTCAAAWQTRV